MLSLSNEVFNALVKYLNGDWSIDQFRDQMVGLRLEKYKLLADADRLFLNEFEGRYAEFSDFDKDESLLKASLVNYVRADEPATVPSLANSWYLQSGHSGGSLSMTSSVGVSSPTGSLASAVGACR
jgi:hypothetical protein